MVGYKISRQSGTRTVLTYYFRIPMIDGPLALVNVENKENIVFSTKNLR